MKAKLFVMKKIIVFTFSLLLSCSIFAQGHLTATNWKVKGFGISLGYDQDMLHNMDHSYFLSTIRGNTSYNYSNLNFEKEHVWSMACENPNLRLNLTLLPPLMRNVELNVSLVGIIGRIDYVSYRAAGTNWGDPDYQSMSFDLSTDEIDLEASIVKRFPVGRTFNLYTGVGTNLGVSTRGDLSVEGHNVLIEDNDVIGLRNPEDSNSLEHEEYFSEYYSTKTTFSQRVFVQAGFGFTILQRFELGMDYRRGLGYRAVGGAPTNGTHLQSVGLNLKWLLR